ncbi:hypothetical protein IKG33_02730 [Candidatus Saccharibacteria bacterium]|nr:hypothetical protein [Candidatus Saccharibacteria bacterium]
MAEELRSVKEILEELFKGRDAALEKYAKVRIAWYEISLWNEHNKAGYEIKEIPKSVRGYFSRRFLNGKPMNKATEAELEEARKRLFAAAHVGCKKRCERLVDELNHSLENNGLRTIAQPDRFLDWLTFNYEVEKDYEGNPVIEKPFGFPIITFDSDRNRREFWGELKVLLEQYGRMMSMQDVEILVLMKRRNSVVLRD